MSFYERLVRDTVVHAARTFYRLYANRFRSLPLPEAELGAAASDPAPAKELLS